MYGWMVNGWMVGWMDGWLDGWMDGEWMDGLMDGWLVGWVGWMVGWLFGWMDDGCMYGWVTRLTRLTRHGPRNHGTLLCFVEYSHKAILAQTHFVVIRLMTKLSYDVFS